MAGGSEAAQNNAFNKRSSKRVTTLAEMTSVSTFCFFFHSSWQKKVQTGGSKCESKGGAVSELSWWETGHLPTPSHPQPLSCNLRGLYQKPSETGHFLTQALLPATWVPPLPSTPHGHVIHHEPFRVLPRTSRSTTTWVSPHIPTGRLKTCHTLEDPLEKIWRNEVHFGAEVKFTPASLVMLHHPHTWHTWTPEHPIKSNHNQLHIRGA